MTAWDRLPQDYRDLCAAIAKNSKIGSPQNKRVRAAADSYLASQKVEGQ